jgi:hypothetical protein
MLVSSGADIATTIAPTEAPSTLNVYLSILYVTMIIYTAITDQACHRDIPVAWVLSKYLICT